MTQIRLGDLLIRAQVVSEAQLNAALAEQKQWGGRLGSILVRMGVLSEDLLAKALAKQLNLPRAALGPTDPIDVPEGIRGRVDRAACERLSIVPIGWIPERKTVVVAVADPLNVVAIDDFSRRMGARLELMIASETQVMQAIARVFSNIDGMPRGGEEGLSFIDNTGRTMSQTPQMAGVAPTMTPQPAWAPPTAPPQPAFATAPPQQAYAPTAPPQQAYAPTAPPQQAGPLSDDLRVLAEQQRKAVRALVELLVERGVVNAAELQAWLQR